MVANHLSLFPSQMRKVRVTFTFCTWQVYILYVWHVYILIELIIWSLYYSIINGFVCLIKIIIIIIIIMVSFESVVNYADKV